jgi:hypothetical protein
MELTHVSTNEQLTDIFTKPLVRIKFESMRSRLQIQSLEKLNKLGILKKKKVSTYGSLRREGRCEKSREITHLKLLRMN